MDRDVLNLTLYEWPENENDPTYIHASNTLKWGETCLKDEIFPREDYRELLELTVIFLGGQIPPPRKFVLRKPGAYHHARFMHKEIYYLKLFLISERFALSDVEKSQIKRMATFIGVFHSYGFLRSR